MSETVIDGYIVNEETGEIIGCATLEHNWVPKTKKDMEFILENMSTLDAQKTANDLRIKAIQESLEAQNRKLEAQRKFWEWKFGNDLINYAKEQLANSKSRTYQFDYGKVSFRTSKGTNKITDMDKAVAWAKKHFPDIVIVEERVNVTDILEKTEHVIEDNIDFIDSTGPQEKITISTGI